MKSAKSVKWREDGTWKFGKNYDWERCQIEREALHHYFLRGLQMQSNYSTGVPRSSETAPSWRPTVGFGLGPYGGPKASAFANERSTPVPLPRGKAKIESAGRIFFCKPRPETLSPHGDPRGGGGGS